MVVPAPVQKKPMDSFAKDAVISWFRGEFAAANAIIDELCGHLRRIEGGGSGDYESAFAAIHRRRLNWIPVLNMQKFYTIADVIMELDRVAAKKRAEIENVDAVKTGDFEAAVVGDENLSRDGTHESEITDTGSQEIQPSADNIITCSNREECEQRRVQIKTNKLFVAKEPVKGHMVNVVRGLKLYENIFTDLELSKLKDFVNQLRVAGQNGELSGETFILYNQQTKGNNKRELIQLGVPIFERIKEDTTDQSQQSYIEPIPAVLQGVIEHLIHLRLIPEHKKPSSCFISFFDEGGYSHPFLKPPHLDQPFSTLLLCESRMAYGRALASDSEGNYTGSLMLSLKEGSLLVMRGNSSDTARHAMCSSENKRVSITFFKVRTETTERNDTTHTNTMGLWQPGSVIASPYTIPNNYQQMNVIPPFIMAHNPMVVCPHRDGTGVFLPEGTGSRLRKPAKQLPPRAQRRRFFSLPSLIDGHKSETTSDSGSTTS